MIKEEIQVKVFEDDFGNHGGLLVILQSEINGETFIGPYSEPMITTKERWLKEKNIVINAFKESIINQTQK